MESVDEQYQLSGPELGYELGGLGGLGIDLIGLLMPLNTQTNVQQTELTIYVPTSNVNYVSWYVTIITASDAFGFPSLGFIVNASSYYQNPGDNLHCNG